MPVLTDNYSTTEPIRPLLANFGYNTEPEPITNSIVVGLSQQIGLNNRIHKLLEEYSKLQSNWDDDGAVAPNEMSILQAIYITTLLERHGQSIFHAAPGPNGEIMLDIRNNKKTRSLELIFYPTRSIAVTFPEDQKPVQQNFELPDLPGYLEWLNKK